MKLLGKGGLLRIGIRQRLEVGLRSESKRVAVFINGNPDRD